MNWFEEFVIVLAYSTKTQVAVCLGLISFIVILLLGQHFVNEVQFAGPLAPLGDSVRVLLAQRYEKAAWGGLIGFLALAFKCYRKDHKRLLDM